jgi:hypothetical protein
MSFDSDEKIAKAGKNFLLLPCSEKLIEISRGEGKSIKNIKKFYGAASVGLINGLTQIILLC